MCFSPTASFVASGLLAIIGALCLRSMPSKKYFMAAITPLMFAAQQAAEGIVWLTIGRPEHAALLNYAIHVYIFFASIVWPLWIPTTLWMIERNKRRAQVLIVPFIVGICFVGTVKIILITQALNYTPIAAQIVHCHIVYSSIQKFDQYFLPLLCLYACAVITPFFISSIRNMWMFGVLALVSLMASCVIWYEYLGSVWCFFAALISSSLLYYLQQEKH